MFELCWKPVLLHGYCLVPWLSVGGRCWMDTTASLHLVQNTIVHIDSRVELSRVHDDVIFSVEGLGST